MSLTWAATIDTGGPGGELWGAALRLVLALLILLPLVYGATLLYSKRMGPGGSGRALKMIDAIHLGPNRTICLIEVEGRILVIGATQHHISTLAELNDPEVVNRLVSAGSPGVTGAFAKILDSKLWSREKVKDGGEGK